MLKGKVAVVTGGSRGIGAAIVKALAKEGCNVAIVYAGNTELAESVASECAKDFGVEAKSYKCNVSDFAQVKETVGLIKKDFGTVDILVNDAGITRDKLVPMMQEAEFDDVIATNLKGTFNMIRHTYGIFMKARSGKIINVSSVSGMIGNPGQANYSASKAGVIGLTKSVARELAPRGVTCNAVAPGFVQTDMTKNLTDDVSELEKGIPLGRLGKPEDIAEAVVFLAKADYITGEVIRVDGGIAI